MLLGQAFQPFVQRSPVGVVVNGIMERVFDINKLEELFPEHAVLQCTKELTFAQCLDATSDVVFQRSSSVGAANQTLLAYEPTEREDSQELGQRTVGFLLRTKAFGRLKIYLQT